jgi:DNA polymerase-3 subunit alpha (Gram-positive type)
MRISGEKMEKALVNSKTYISIDIETTGFSIKKGAEIIEIAAVKIDTVNKKRTGVFQTFVKPVKRKTIPKKIVELTNINQDMVKDAPFIESALRSLNNFIKNYPLVFHNASFDWDRFLDPLFRKQGIVKNNLIIDTLPIAKVCFPNIKSRKLQSVCNHLGYNTSFHRAITDARATATVAYHCKKILEKKYEIKPEENKEIQMSISTEDKTLPDLRIKSFNYWEKAKYKRVYVLTTWGNVFYDFKTKEWSVKNATVEKTIDFKKIEDKFLKASRLKSLKEAEQKFVS